MHAHIIATSFNIPTIGLIWNDKIKWFAKHMRISERFFDCAEMKDYDKIYSAFENAIYNKKEINLEQLKQKTKEKLSDFILKN